MPTPFEGDQEVLAATWRRGLSPIVRPPHLTLDAWASRHFYLSKESSYVEQGWKPWPFQRAILSAMSHDDIEDVDVIKSARIGYTKMLLAAVGYFAHHKKRNQAIWQPTDDDVLEFVKTELDPMLRDVYAMRDVFPSMMRRDKDNTLSLKKFLSSNLYIKGGKAAKNYRRISVDTVYLDELDAFDSDVEREGSPVSLSNKRTEGASFPKRIRGSTPKLKHFSQIEDCVSTADLLFHYHIPCPHCGQHHALTWGDKDSADGFKWMPGDDGLADPDSVRHACPHCGVLIEQHEYLAIADQGRWYADNGVAIDNDGNFFDPAGLPTDAPRHVAFHIWTAYSPNVTWSSIVREFLAAYEQMQLGDATKMQTFANTTLGRSWEGDLKSVKTDELQERAEPYKLGIVPPGGLVLLAGVDTQDDRLECSVWAFGRGCEMWVVDHRVFYGNPEEEQVWKDLDEYVFGEFPHASGATMRLAAIAIDTQGHNTHAVYSWCYRNRRRRVFAVAGRSGKEKAIVDGSSLVEVTASGRRIKNGLRLWQVGTNFAKDRILARLAISRPGPGYIHFSDELPDSWFKQFTGEVRASKNTPSGEQFKWTAIRKRVEALDCCVYALFLEASMHLDRKPSSFWKKLEERAAPATADLFRPLSPDQPLDEAVTGTKELPIRKPVPTLRRPRTNFATNW